MVDLPLAERPVNQTVKPCWPRKLLRSACVRDGCQVIFLFLFLTFEILGFLFLLGGGKRVFREREGEKKGGGKGAGAGAYLRCCHFLAGGGRGIFCAVMGHEKWRIVWFYKMEGRIP